MADDLSMYKIADAMQIKLEISGKEVKGQKDATFTPYPGLSLPVSITAKKMFKNGAAGVVFHVMGDLHMVVAYYSKTGAVSAFLIDGTKLKMQGIQQPPENMISKTMTLKDVVDAIKVGVVSSFIWKDRQWRALKLPA
jgi:hypothetical protein